LTFFLPEKKVEAVARITGRSWHLTAAVQSQMSSRTAEDGWINKLMDPVDGLCFCSFH